MSIVRPPFPRGVALLAGALALGGCLDVGPTQYKINGSVTTETAIKRSSELAPAQASPRRASVAFASLEGSPAPQAARFAADLAAAADGRAITVADARSARYVVRGYLTAYPEQDGTTLSCVWDVFDAKQHRAQRVADTVTVKTVAPDPWSAIDDGTLQAAAARSADDLADFLASTPEALADAGAAVANAAGSTTVAAAPPPAAADPAVKLVSYAGAE